LQDCPDLSSTSDYGNDDGDEYDGDKSNDDDDHYHHHRHHHHAFYYDDDNDFHYDDGL
jgi:hypothetical protein